MKEYYFRAKKMLADGVPGEWVSGDNMRTGGEERPHTTMISGVPVVQETLGQFTGLLGSKEDKIFEGDVVSYEYKGSLLVHHHNNNTFGNAQRFIVMWLPSGFTLVPPVVYNNLRGDVSPLCQVVDNYEFWANHSRLDILGNVYDNPELVYNIRTEGEMLASVANCPDYFSVRSLLDNSLVMIDKDKHARTPEERSALPRFYEKYSAEVSCENRNVTFSLKYKTRVSTEKVSFTVKKNGNKQDI